MSKVHNPHGLQLIHGSGSPSKSPFQAPDALASALTSISKLVAKPTGETIFRENDPAHGVYLVRAGKVRVSLRAPSGKLLINRSLTPGALMGVPAAMCDGHFQFNADALEACELGYVETPLLNAFLRTQPEFCMQVVEMMSSELTELQRSREFMRDCGHPECALYDACKHCHK
jgi:CRP-like cAMP-binding protein